MPMSSEGLFLQENCHPLRILYSDYFINTKRLGLFYKISIVEGFFQADGKYLLG